MGNLRTVPEALADAARGGEGFVFITDGVETRRSYAEILESSRRVAGALAEAGLRRGDLVALVIGEAEPFLTTLFGASIAGVIPAPLYPPPPTTRESRYLEATAGILRAADARAVVTTRALKPAFGALRATAPRCALILAREDLDAPPIDAVCGPSLDDIAFVQFTSGSTSAPKGVAVTHHHLAANVDAFNGASGLKASSDDTGVSWLPLYHDMGLVGMTLGAVYSGRPSVFLSPVAFVRRPVEWLRAMTRFRATVSFAPTFAYDLCIRRVKDRDLEDLDLSRWRVAGCGGEPIHAPTLVAFAEKFAQVGFRETSFVPSYGLAEHVLAATFAPLGRRPLVDRVSSDDLTDRRVATPASDADRPAVSIVSCGTSFPGHRLRIVDEQGCERPERHVGEITLAGPSVMFGYYRDDALTAETIRDGWLHTGDLGYVSNGELFVCGRAKDIIIANGRKYHPQDLEWSVDDLAGVRRGRVVAFGSTRAGEPDRVILVIEPSGTVPIEDLTHAIRRRIGEVCGLYVDEVAVVPSGTIGRTTSGKVQRTATKKRYERGEFAL